MIRRLFGATPPPPDPVALRAQAQAQVRVELRLRTNHEMQAMLGRLAVPAPVRPEVAAAIKAAADKRDAAAEKAEKLLLDHLTPSQKRSYTERGYFLVKGKKLTYSIDKYANVRLTTKPGGSFCVYTSFEDVTALTYNDYIEREALPTADTAFALKLFIEANEAKFLSIANWSGVYGMYAAHLTIDGTPDKTPPPNPYLAFYGDER